MKTTKPIHEHLLMTIEDYNSYLLEHLMRWTMETERKTGVSFQVIIANTGINNWYNTNISKLHNTAHEILNKSEGLKYSQKRIIYGSIISEIFINYPLPLIEIAKKLKIENYAN